MLVWNLDRSPVPLLDIVIAGTEVFISRLGQSLARAFLDVFQVPHIFVANATEKPNRGDFRKNGLHAGENQKLPCALGGVAGVCDEKTDRVWCNFP